MAGDVEFNADDIERLTKNIKAHGNRKALEKELRSGLNRVSKDIRGQLTRVIPAALPKRGGLANTIHEATKSRTAIKGGKWAGVSMVFRAKGHDIRTITGKRLRHPVHGNRSVWVEQTKGIEPAVWTAEIDKQEPAIRRALVAVMAGVANKMGRGL